MSTIHGGSWKVLKHFRKHPAALPCYWAYCAHRNPDGVAFPSLRGLATELDWSVPECQQARDWLVASEALEPVEDYVRPAWRKLDEKTKQRRLNLDKSQYFRITGTITIDGKAYPMLYNPAQDAEADDVQPRLTSSADEHQPGLTSNGADDQPRLTELDSIPELSPKALELDSNPQPDSSQATTPESDPVYPSAPVAEAGVQNLDTPPESDSFPEKATTAEISDFMTTLVNEKITDLTGYARDTAIDILDVYGYKVAMLAVGRAAINNIRNLPYVEGACKGIRDGNSGNGKKFFKGPISSKIVQH